MARAFLELTALPNAGSGGGDTGENGTPVTFSGNVKRVEDRIELVAARMLGGIEHKNDRCIIAGHTSSDDETGDYQLDVEAFGGDSFIVCMDDYGALYPAGNFVAVGPRIHPTTPNGFVYRVEQAGPCRKLNRNGVLIPAQRIPVPLAMSPCELCRFSDRYATDRLSQNYPNNLCRMTITSKDEVRLTQTT